jgi:hypothetical protein
MDETAESFIKYPFHSSILLYMPRPVLNCGALEGEAFLCGCIQSGNESQAIINST